jgi:hypothetical protein
VAAILTRAEAHAVGIGIGAGRVARRRDERPVAELLAGGLEDQPRLGGLERRLWIVVAPRRFERIAARHERAFDVSGLAGEAIELLEQVVVGLHFGVGDAPILDRHVGRDRLLAVARLNPCAQDRIVFRPPPGEAVPMARCATEPISRQKRGEPARGKRLVFRIVADRVGLDRPILTESAAGVPSQLVALVGKLRRGSVAPVGAALQHQDIGAFRSQLPGNECRGQSAANDDDGAFVQLGGHSRFPQLKSTMDLGSLAPG